ncbi:2-hydroxychromene-2-carboxylate isomerase [Paraburkholderia phenazinium]|jgi:2-hydroxychromene-2-carboxylate isomerase|uniref:2-hydroxychromene-2-carboxylate isomerase n=1 Tax=Paraburkholderia phenazinium TaxID=60549 RepID=A0A1G8HP36_9BURK|nr:2-hydroxychromene-2-carboxylate isomerase [Paraburkholderia phenazinium]SDI08399.1 2-hydroxychromene-2-carboxylate isomerase [Paraburkholderia phenazinium]
MTDGIDATQPLWFYDFVSPFTYLLLEQHDKWPGFEFVPTPVVLNQLYEHWGQRPAYGVPPKRVYMYRHALFRADQLGIPFKMPPAHPFDSTKAMLLAVAVKADIHCVRDIFRFIWREGRDPSSDEGFAALCERIGVPDGPELIEREEVKAQLLRNTTDAIALGVFGVPTFWLNDQLFWGEDALPMVLYCARTPNWLDSKEVKRISTLPSGIQV